MAIKDVSGQQAPPKPPPAPLGCLIPHLALLVAKRFLQPHLLVCGTTHPPTSPKGISIAVLHWLSEWWVPGGGLWMRLAMVTMVTTASGDGLLPNCLLRHQHIWLHQSSVRKSNRQSVNTPLTVESVVCRPYQPVWLQPHLQSMGLQKPPGED